jgi:nicotinamide riboside kinase
LSTVVYCDHYFGRCPPWIVEAAAERRPNLYLLCDIDIPWVEDGIRDRGHAREELQRLFREAIERSGVPAVVIKGDRDERFDGATSAIDALLA